MRRRPLLLIVEDDRALRELYRVALSVSNFEVHSCEDGLDALRYLDQERPDVIVLDLNLPRVRGTDIYHELRAHAVTANVPIVVCTGVDPVPNLPGATILRKPCSPERLIAAVQRALRPQQRAWLYVREEQSVRLVRTGGDEGGPMRLFVYGPGEASAVFEDTETMSVATRQAAIQRTLVAEGFRLVPLVWGDRRGSKDRWATPPGRSPDRRRRE